MADRPAVHADLGKNIGSTGSVAKTQLELFLFLAVASCMGGLEVELVESQLRASVASVLLDEMEQQSCACMKMDVCMQAACRGP